VARHDLILLVKLRMVDYQIEVFHVLAHRFGVVVESAMPVRGDLRLALTFGLSNRKEQPTFYFSVGVTRFDRARPAKWIVC
jgi:hypothetical protein